MLFIASFKTMESDLCDCVCVCVYDLFVNYFPADSDGSCCPGLCVIFDQSLASFGFFFLNVQRLMKQLFFFLKVQNVNALLFIRSQLSQFDP